MSTRIMTPVIALVDEVALAKLQPIVDDLALRLGAAWTTKQLTVMSLNGWTTEMVAWGRVLAAVAAEDIEVVAS